MYIYIIKLHYAKFGVPNLFFSKVIEENPLEVGSTPAPLGTGRVRICDEIMKTFMSVARFWDFAVSSTCCKNKMNDVLC